MLTVLKPVLVYDRKYADAFICKFITLCHQHSQQFVIRDINFSDPLRIYHVPKLQRKIRRHHSVGCLWHSHGKNSVRLYPKLQSQPIGLHKIVIDHFFFQVDQWDCTKPLSIFDRLASSEERFRTFHCTNKLQSQPIGLPKIFIDYLFFQADQSDCTKSVSIFNRFASSEER